MRPGLKRIEVVMAVGCGVLLLGLLTPAFVHLREQQREAQCAENLRRLGELFHAHADHDPMTRFSTGALDFEYDGCPDQHSWVGNVLPHLGGRHGTLHCPSSNLAGMQHLNQLLIASAPVVSEPDSRFDSGLCNAVDGILSTEPLSAERAERVRNLVARGYNTTYSPSWHFARGEALVVDTEPDRFRSGCDGLFIVPGDLRSLETVSGPLTLRIVEQSDYPSSMIALLGDGAHAADLTTAVSKRLALGSRLGQPFGSGPSFRDRSSHSIRPLSAEPGMLSIEDMGTEEGAWWFRGSATPPRVLQDTRHWSATHSNRGHILMADGGVQVVEDINDDGLFNPGFGASHMLDERDYQSASVEMPPARFWNGTIWSSWSCRGGHRRFDGWE